jgi:hypothetical protein
MIRNNADTLVNFLKDSNVNPKVEIMEEERVRVCSLPRSTSRVGKGVPDDALPSSLIDLNVNPR